MPTNGSSTTTAGAPPVMQSADMSSGPPSVAGLFRGVLALAAGLGGIDAATLTVLQAVTSAGNTDRGSVAQSADELQYDCGEGPCLTAARSGVITIVENLGSERRWPRWIPQAQALGIGSVLTVPFPAAGPTGSINLYSLRPRCYQLVDVEQAVLLAAHAAAVCAVAESQRNLLRALETRTEIGQAIGILVERYRITPSVAFSVLRRYSQAFNTKVSALATQLATEGQLPHLGLEWLEPDFQPPVD